MIRAIARQAEAERERRAKVINAEGEQQAAAKLLEAAEILARQGGGLERSGGAFAFAQDLFEQVFRRNRGDSWGHGRGSIGRRPLLDLGGGGGKPGRIPQAQAQIGQRLEPRYTEANRK